MTRESGPATVLPNTSFNGTNNFNLLVPGCTLLPGETAHLRFEVEVTEIADPQGNGLSLFQNQVQLVSSDPHGNLFSDLSTDGDEPDPSGDGDPGNDQVPSQGTLTPDATVGVAKEATLASDFSSVTYDMRLEHFGNTIATAVSLLDDLDAVFGAGRYSVASTVLISGPATFMANGGFDGSGDQELIAIGSTMSPGESAHVQVVVDLINPFGNYINQAEATTTDTDSTPYSDLSDDGNDPDPSGTGQPRAENDPTPIFVPIGEVHGSVFADPNNNGLQDATELPLPGVTITLTGTDVRGNNVMLTTMSGPDGTYSFLDLLPGDYTIVQSQPAGFLDGQDIVGDQGGSNPSNDHLQFTLSSAAPIASGYNFAEIGLDPLSVGKEFFLASNQGASGGVGPHRARWHQVARWLRRCK